MYGLTIGALGNAKNVSDLGSRGHNNVGEKPNCLSELLHGKNINIALLDSASVNRILKMERVCFISISGALIGNVLAPAPKKKTIFKTSETRGRRLSKG
jgi:hypothetical protein